MCVPKSEEELGCSFLGSPGKKAGQQECGTVGTEAPLPELQPRAELELYLGEGNPRLELLNPACLPPELLAEKGTKFRAGKGGKNKN